MPSRTSLTGSELFIVDNSDTELIQLGLASMDNKHYTDILYARSRSQDREIRVEEAAAWLTRELQKIGEKWTPLVTLKVARGMLAALSYGGNRCGAPLPGMPPARVV